MPVCPSSASLVLQRYRKHYAIDSSTPLTEDMIRAHWNLERRVARALRASTPASRARVFEEGYGQLFGQLEWLNAVHESGVRPNPDFPLWSSLIGGACTVYEVGSGNGRLLLYLAEHGHRCRGTEITPQRGEALAPANPGVSWGVSDGVHLAQFEPPDSVDVVISNQVVEHLHPDDVSSHLAGALAILRPGGRYILTTPHAAFGPSDVSAIFGCTVSQGTHLREYPWSELVRLSRTAGFVDAQAVLILPRLLRRGPLRGYALSSTAYLHYVGFVEGCLRRIRQPGLRRSLARGMRLALFPASIWLVLGKPQRESPKVQSNGRSLPRDRPRT
jgi:SAM-dependent methyltransferase